MPNLLENSEEYRNNQISNNEYHNNNEYNYNDINSIIFVDGKEYNINDFLNERILSINEFSINDNEYPNNKENNLNQIIVDGVKYDVDKYVDEKVKKFNTYDFHNNEYDNSNNGNLINEININNQNIDIENYRNNILKRNIYTPNNEYEIDNLIIDSINSISDDILPYINTTSLSNEINAINRLYSAITNQTKLVQIGKKKLGDQLLKTISSNISKSISEKVNLSNLVKKDKSIFENRDYHITKRGTLDVIDDITGNAFGVFTSNLGNLVSGLIENLINNPLNKRFEQIDYLDDTRNKFILDNTGKGQVENIKLNVENNQYVLTYLKDNIDNLNNNQVINNKVYFSRNDYIVDPELGNDLIKENYINNNQYETDQITLFGKTNLYEKNENWDDDEHINDDVNKEFIWGKDINQFNIQKGLLKYTNALMNSSEDSIIYKGKTFYNPRNKSKFDGYSGAGIYNIPEEALRINSNLEDGIRQHNLEDQYDRYAKAIRFNGNRIYGGNKNTTNYDIVIPKFHPLRDDNGNIDNRNMMFSIENLAININRIDEDENLCYLNDEFDTPLPLSEKGPLNGRIMWFPPYDLKLIEDVSNDLTSTKFIGRGEPVYTYNNTERSATISFKLLIDMPPQLKEIPKENFHKKASEFFLFSGKYDLTLNNLKELEEQLNLINIELQNYEENINIITPSFEEQILTVYFDNDSDKIIESYENDITEPEKGEVEDYGLNLDFFYSINDFVNEYFIDEYKDYISIEFIGNSSNLYYDADKEPEYNKNLSQRRINSVINYINNIYGGDIRTDFNVKEKPLGSENAEEPNDKSIIHSRDVKLERNVEIKISKNKTTDIKNTNLTPEQQKQKRELLEQKDNIEAEISILKQKIKQINANEFNKIEIDDRYFKGFEWAEKNIFKPCFYSQTPEDFHRRLTFLQQCMRQGKNIESGNITNSVFGRQPVLVLRIGDFFHTKIMIESLALDYSIDVPWDLNPEGMGIQPMLADINMKIKIIGGQSLATPISILQNAISFNYYANSTFYNSGTYSTPTNNEIEQIKENNKEI